MTFKAWMPWTRHPCYMCEVPSQCNVSSGNFSQKTFLRKLTFGLWLLTLDLSPSTFPSGASETHFLNLGYFPTKFDENRSNLFSKSFRNKKIYIWPSISCLLTSVVMTTTYLVEPFILIHAKFRARTMLPLGITAEKRCLHNYTFNIYFPGLRDTIFHRCVPFHRVWAESVPLTWRSFGYKFSFKDVYCAFHHVTFLTFCHGNLIFS